MIRQITVMMDSLKRRAPEGRGGPSLWERSPLPNVVGLVVVSSVGQNRSFQ